MSRLDCTKSNDSGLRLSFYYNQTESCFCFQFQITDETDEKDEKDEKDE